MYRFIPPASVAFICILFGCGRVDFEQLSNEEKDQDGESDANREERIDASTVEDAVTYINVDTNIQLDEDASYVIDGSNEDSNTSYDASQVDVGSETDAEYDAALDAVATDAISPDDTTNDAADATPPSDAASDAETNTCELSGVTYEDGQSAALSGTLLITAAHSGKCAAIDNGSLDRDTVVVQQSCDYSPSQLWEPLDLGNSWFALRSAQSGHYMMPDKEDTSDGVEVVQWDGWFSETQQYQVVCAGNDQWRIVNRISSLSLTVEGGSTANGAHFTGRTDQELANQRFQIESQTDVFVPILPTAEQGVGTVWRYWTGTQPSGWSEEAFDDSGWSQGPGGFGQGDDRGNIGTTWDTSNIWIRTTFELSSPLPSTLSLRIYHDESAEVYVNGVAVFIRYSWVSGYLQVELDASAYDALRVGTNVIAVYCLNTTGPQYIDVGLGTYTWNTD